jgi:uncharacterized protein YigA (DUF484 family)
MTKKEDIHRINEDIAARFQEIEKALLSARTIAGLFEALVEGIERVFGVPFVWLTFMDRPGADALTNAAVASEVLKGKFSVVSAELLEKILPGGLQPVLSNQNLQPFYRLMPSSQKYFVRSIAVVPFALEGQMIGTWNNGDADAAGCAGRQDFSSADGAGRGKKCRIRRREKRGTAGRFSWLTSGLKRSKKSARRTGWE